MRTLPYAVFLICGITIGLFLWALSSGEGADRGLGLAIFIPYVIIVYGPSSIFAAYLSGMNRGDPVLKFLTIFTFGLHALLGLALFGLIGALLDYIALAYVVSTFIAPIVGYFNGNGGGEAV